MVPWPSFGQLSAPQASIPLFSVTPPAKPDILTSVGITSYSVLPNTFSMVMGITCWAAPLSKLFKLGNRPCAQWCRGVWGAWSFSHLLLKQNLVRLYGLWVLLWLLLHSLSSLVRPARLGSSLYGLSSSLLCLLFHIFSPCLKEKRQPKKWMVLEKNQNASSP